MSRLDLALQHAKQIRRNLLRSKSGYDPDGHRSWPRSLKGACGVAALQLAVRLGDPKTLCTGAFYVAAIDPWDRLHDHAWNLVGNYIVDITATQFACDGGIEYPAVHVVHRNSKEAFRYFFGKRGLKAAHELCQWEYKDADRLVAQLAAYS